jgi:Ca2+-binding EF-hand superfamily protein
MAELADVPEIALTAPAAPDSDATPSEGGDSGGGMGAGDEGSSIMGTGFLVADPSNSGLFREPSGVATMLTAADALHEDSLRGAVSMNMSVNLTSEQARLKELSVVFNLFDTAGRGFISVDDLPVVLKSLGISKEYLSEEVYESIKAALDPKRDGMVRFDSYLQIVGPCMPQPGSFEEQFRVFRMMDRDRKGCVSLEDLVAVGNVECMGLLSEHQCQFIISQLKTTTRPGITFDEFKRAVGTQMHLFEDR